VLSLLRHWRLILGALAVAAALGAGWHYRAVVAERDALRGQMAQAAADRAALERALSDERAAAEAAARSRDDAARALAAFRAGRRDDPEARAWGEAAIPPTEAARMCEALPTMKGCPRAP
jgi:hypothetical protein